MHGAVASLGLGDEVADAALADWRRAPLSPALRATLGFVERLTLDPGAVSVEDARTALAAGVSRAALEQAVYVCSMFNTLTRIADALGFAPLSAAQRAKTAAHLLRAGYLGP